MKKAIYKCRVEIDDDGKVSVCSVSNIRIPYSVLMPLNEAVHEAARTINGTNSWKKRFVKFEHNEKKYVQVEAEKFCEGCVFHYNKDGRTCQHPYFETKDKCTGRIYKEENN